MVFDDDGCMLDFLLYRSGEKRGKELQVSLFDSTNQ